MEICLTRSVAHGLLLRHARCLAGVVREKTGTIDGFRRFEARTGTIATVLSCVHALKIFGGSWEID